MRIGFDMGPIGKNRTGVGNYCFSLLKALLELPDAPEIHGLATCLHRPALNSLSSQASCKHVAIPTRAMYALWNATGLPAVESLVGNVDVYHATNYFLPPSRRARRVLSIHDLAFLVHPEWCSPKVSGPFSRRIHRFAQEADLILAMSKATKGDIVRRLDVAEAKVRVTYEAANASLQPVPGNEAMGQVAERFGIRGPYLLFAGTIEPRKNVFGLIQAFQRLAGSAPHQLVLAGAQGWNAKDTLSAMADPAVASRITRTGFVSTDDLAALYSAADAFVFPSFYEGFGLPVLEAMTCGCPVIASNTSSLPEVCGDAAVYCDPGDVESITGAIDRVLNDANLRARMIAAGHNRTQRFTWRSCAEATLAAYREAAS